MSRMEIRSLLLIPNANASLYVVPTTRYTILKNKECMVMCRLLGDVHVCGQVAVVDNYQ